MVELVYISGKRYGYEKPFRHELLYDGSGLFITIPSNADYDFDISVPKCLEWAQSPHDKIVLIGAGVHDWLLEAGCDPAVASAEFRRVVRQYGVGAQKGWRLFFTTMIVTSFRAF